LSKQVWYIILKANNLGLLDPDIKKLPENSRKRIIVFADSTFLITSGSTRDQKDEKGQWHFKKKGVKCCLKRDRG